MSIFSPRKLHLSCFGKLRISPDFVEVDQVPKFDSQLRDWLQSGDWGSRDIAEVTAWQPRCYRFLWPSRDGRELALGVLWSSGDSRGAPFPFAIYTQLTTKRLGLRSLSEICLAVDPIWRDLEALGRSGENLWTQLTSAEVDATSLRKQVQAARLHYPPAMADAEFDASLEAWTARDILEQLLSSSYWVIYPRVAWHMLSFVRGFAAGGAPLSAVRLPASPRLSSSFQATFWLKQMEAAGVRLFRPPCLFLPRAEVESAGLWILFREPQSFDLAPLFGSRDACEQISDLRRARQPEAEGFGKFATSVQDWLASPQTAINLLQLSSSHVYEEVT